MILSTLYKGMDDIKTQTVKLCECGCGQPAPVATRNWHFRGIKKGDPLRFVCGHHRRNVKQSKEEKEKRVRSWGVEDFAISPFLPDNVVVRYETEKKRWYCFKGRTGGRKPHARVVYEHFKGPVPLGYVVHHKSGNAESLESDKPDNLVAIPKNWNLLYLPLLAREFAVPESKVTECFLAVVDKVPITRLFREICKLLLEDTA